MPECAIGLMPDVGGTQLLAQAPGLLGEYLGLTGGAHGAGATRSSPASPTPSSRKPTGPASPQRSARDGRRAARRGACRTGPEGALAGLREAIDDAFAAADLAALVARLEASDWGHGVLKMLSRHSPLSMACTLELVRAARRDPGIEKALRREYRFTWRSASDGDLLEGIRAAVIDKDRDPSGATPWTACGTRTWPRCSHRSAPTIWTWPRRPDGEGEPMQIGFIGLGNMGAPMAANLAAAGHEVTGFDVAGVTVEGSGLRRHRRRGRDRARRGDHHAADGAILRRVYDESCRPAVPARSFSTARPSMSKAPAPRRAAGTGGSASVDAPVSGGTSGAAAGTLTFMAGGIPEALRPLVRSSM